MSSALAITVRFKRTKVCVSGFTVIDILIVLFVIKVEKLFIITVLYFDK